MKNGIVSTPFEGRPPSWAMYDSSPLTQEQEICPNCQAEQTHIVQWRIMSNGGDYRKGQCEECGHGPRALPLHKPAEEEVFYFGKHKRKLLKDVPSDYLEWVLVNVELRDGLYFKVQELLAKRRA